MSAENKPEQLRPEDRNLELVRASLILAQGMLQKIAEDETVLIFRTSVMGEVAKVVQGGGASQLSSRTRRLLTMGILTGELVAANNQNAQVRQYPMYKISKPTLEALIGLTSVHAADPNLRNQHFTIEEKLTLAATEAKRVFEEINPEVAAVINLPEKAEGAAPTIEQLSQIINWFRDRVDSVSANNPMKTHLMQMKEEMDSRVNTYCGFDYPADEKTDPHLVTPEDLQAVSELPVEVLGELDTKMVMTEINARLIMLCAATICPATDYDLGYTYPDWDDSVSGVRLRSATKYLLRVIDHANINNRPCDNLAELVEMVIAGANRKYG